jgi:hypothetical protein
MGELQFSRLIQILANQFDLHGLTNRCHSWLNANQISRWKLRNSHRGQYNREKTVNKATKLDHNRGPSD